ncbi:MAG: lysophospholipid acyltransferase family protein, partial [Deltaproteobacteria bacterium]|nr:lysophospholipid acyltransferase family protein [Deltaproteobacteria bacterium]
FTAFRLLEGLASTRSWEKRGTLGKRLGALWHALDAGHRRVALDNVALAFPEWEPERVRRLVRANFAHLGAVAAEFLGMGFLSRDELLRRTTFEGAEHLLEARERGKGVFILCSHQGNWELAGAAMTATFSPVYFLGRRLKNAGVDRRVTELRQRFGGTAIGHRDAVRPVLKALRQGGIVGFLMDQKALAREAEPSRYFGRPVATNQGLAVLALKTGAPVVPAFGTRVPGGQVIRLGPALVLPADGTLEEKVQRFTQAFDDTIEAAVRACPEQWFWVHRRWRLPEAWR